MFLGRQTYRRRRVIDALRLLPVVGALAFFAPLLGGGVRATAAVGLYVFSAWLGLIVLAALLVRVLGRSPGGVGADPAPSGGAAHGSNPDGDA